jgi:hypothetical protein
VHRPDDRDVERTSKPGLRRVVVDWTLVGALLTAAFTGWAGTAHRPVPPALVGVWSGGSHSNGHWYYEFSADGSYRAWPELGPGVVNTGRLVVDDTTITFSNGGAPVTVTWSSSEGRLVLDGDGYVRS